MRKFLTILSVAFVSFALSGCERFNSEFRIPSLNSGLNKPTGEEPLKCDFNAQDNCWVQALNYIEGCMADSLSNKPDKFFDHRAMCRNDKGKLIEFISPQRLELSQKKIYNGPLDIYGYSKGNTCFRIEGRRNNFTITTNVGEIIYLASTDGMVNVRCLDGKYLQTSASILKNRCGFSASEVDKLLPRISFQYENYDGKDGWGFKFFGQPSNSFSIFQCQL